jgi:hypothetical protein
MPGAVVEGLLEPDVYWPPTSLRDNPALSPDVPAWYPRP